MSAISKGAGLVEKLLGKLPKRLVFDVAEHPEVAARVAGGARFQRAVPQGKGIYNVFFKGSKDPLSIDVLSGATGAEDFIASAQKAGRDPFQGARTSGDSFINRIRGKYGDAYKENPLGFGLGVGSAGLGAAAVGVHGFDSITDAATGPDPTDYAVQSALYGSDQSAAGAIRARRIHKSMQENEALLAQLRPDLYQQLSWGEELPTGAVTWGGGPPQRDLLTALSSAMSSGAFSQPEPTDLDLMKQLGLRSKFSSSVGPKGLTSSLSFTRPPGGGMMSP